MFRTAAAWIGVLGFVVWGQTVAQGQWVETNLALRGSARASSEGFGTRASAAIDGNLSGHIDDKSLFHSGSVDDKPTFWEVDLGSDQEIGRVRVWLRTDCCLNRNQELQVTVLNAAGATVFQDYYRGNPFEETPARSEFSMTFGPAIRGRVVRVDHSRVVNVDSWLHLAEVEVIAPYGNPAGIQWVRQPSASPVLEHRSLTLTAEAVPVGGPHRRALSYQWQRNGVDIPGANRPVFETGSLTTASAGDRYRCKALLPGQVLLSAEAVIGVLPDRVAPRVESVTFPGGKPALVFDERLDPSSATTIARYRWSGATVTKATLAADGRTVVLDVPGIRPRSSYEVVVDGVKDLAGNATSALRVAGDSGFFEVNHALLGKARASSEGFGSLASWAIDGNTSGNFGDHSLFHTASDNDQPSFWEVDLGADQEIGMVRLWLRIDCCTERSDRLRVVIKNAAGVEVYRGQYPGNPFPLDYPSYAHVMDPPVVGRVVRVERGDKSDWLMLGEVQVFAPFIGAGREILGLTSQTVVEGQRAFFGPISVSGVPADRLLAQWQRNGVDIPGARGETYATPRARMENSGERYRVKVRFPGGELVSPESVLTVGPDVSRPTVRGIGAMQRGGAQEIGIQFDRVLERSSATDPANYSVSVGKISKVEWVTRPSSGFGGALPEEPREPQAVRLTVTGAPGGAEILVTVRNVRDLNGNAISAEGVALKVKTESAMTWAVVGANEFGFRNDAVRVGEGDFEIISGGSIFWADYDEMTLAYHEVEGDFDASVQVEYQDPSSEWARAGLIVRETLDSGKTRPPREGCEKAVNPDGSDCVKPELRFGRFQSTHANPSHRYDGVVGNNAYENHFRSGPQYQRIFSNQMDSGNNGFGPLRYPNVWVRLTRRGDYVSTYRSVDGERWELMTDEREFRNLASKLYVGIFYAPELVNNNGQKGLGHEVWAAFRNYRLKVGDRYVVGTAPVVTLPPVLSLEPAGEGVWKVRFEGSGVVERGIDVLGPYDPTPLKSGDVIELHGGRSFYRLRR